MIIRAENLLRNLSFFETFSKNIFSISIFFSLFFFAVLLEILYQALFISGKMRYNNIDGGNTESVTVSLLRFQQARGTLSLEIFPVFFARIWICLSYLFMKTERMWAT